VSGLDNHVDRAVARLATQERRLQARERLSLWERLRDCEHRIVLRSTIGAKAYDADTAAQGYESSFPPGYIPDMDDLGLDDLGVAPLEHLLRPLRNALESLEAGLDFDSGWSASRDTGRMISEEKDREILTRWVGMHSGTVSVQAPHLGSQRTIERVRHRAGVQPVSGLPLVVRAAA